MQRGFGNISMVGIYSIENKVTGQIYIGQSVDIERRWMEHKTPKATGNDKLHSDMKRYGLENFSFSVLEECRPEELQEKELSFIREARPYYNTVGKAVSDETKRKISDGTRKWWQTLPEETRDKIISENLKGPAKGHDVSAETREKIRKKVSGIVSERNKVKVRCLETGEIFDSVESFEKSVGACRSSCYAYWTGRIKSVKGYHVEKCRD